MDARFQDVEEHFDWYFELLNALSGRYWKWANPKARKKHRCEFGCSIQPGDRYFRKLTGLERADDVKLCRGCMVKLLFAVLGSDPDTTKRALVFHKENWERTMRAFHSLRTTKPQD